ncbi:MAG: sigma-70 family RNA polymerase sigma factor [Candidatus Aminicenantaceae bacterium]|jgi:RNA polymerase sigma-70 factor (ECF subfamily)
MDDRELVEKAQAGNQDAFGALVEKYRIKMFNLAYSLTRNRETADDLAQEVFIKAYMALPNFKFQSAFSTWIYRIAVNASKDFLRKETRVRKIPLDDSPPGTLMQEDTTGQIDEAREQATRKKMVHTALESLPEKYQVILTLRDIQGFPYNEISQMLNISPGTVDSRLHRARKMLKKKVCQFSARLGGDYAV